MKSLNVGAVLRESFESYREHAGVLLPVAFWLYLLAAIATGLTAPDFALSWLASAFGFFIAILYQGFVVALVREVRGGRRERSVRELVGVVLPVFWPLAGAAMVYGLGVTGGLFLLLVPGLVLLTYWAVVAPVIVVERRRVFDAFGRSRQLVRGVGWPVFWVIVIALLIAVVVGIVLFLLAGALADGPILRIVFSTLGSTVTAPITALVAAVLYYRLLAIEADRSVPASVDPAPPAPSPPASS
jgi:hypothetical protein